jgi:superfamily II DNA or RNA helicase
MGKTQNIPERDASYATGEITRGYFELVFEVPFEKMGWVERALQQDFNELNIKENGGREFYNKKIMNLIEPYLIKNSIEYRKLNEKEISRLIRTNRIRKILNKINIKRLIDYLKSKRTKQSLYTPRKDQIAIIKESCIHFKKNDKGLLVLPCGVGKTLISLWIAQGLNSGSIIIGVPNILLLKQWEKEIIIMFNDIRYLSVCSGVTTDNIKRFLETNKKCIVLTTYASSHKVFRASKNIVFDIKILDEVHHLTTSSMEFEKSKKKYVHMLNIASVKQLGLTATLKTLDDVDVVSNDNVEYFGEIIYKKCLLEAINEDIVCDYVIQTIITEEEQLEDHLRLFNIVEENDKRLFLSAFAALKSIFEGHSHHLLIYTNNTDNSLKVINFIKNLLEHKYFDMDDLYYSNYSSSMTSKSQKDIIKKYKGSYFGIIACVYCLGEGYDDENIDSVVFAENMSSNIRIVQSALRSGRKNKLQHNKISKIILPILNRDDWLENNENQDLKKVREVVYQMGLEDKTIEYKIKAIRIEISRSHKPKPFQKPNEILEFGDYDDEITKILRLKTTKRSALDITYEKARKIIADKNIKSKEEYYILCERDNRLSKDPEIDFKGKFTNWIDYLSIERKYYDLETCKNKIAEYLLLVPDIKKYYLDLSIVSKRLCEQDPLFPPNGLWVEYYNVKDLRDIIFINIKKKGRGCL